MIRGSLHKRYKPMMRPPMVTRLLMEANHLREMTPSVVACVVRRWAWNSFKLMGVIGAASKCSCNSRVTLMYSGIRTWSSAEVIERFLAMMLSSMVTDVGLAREKVWPLTLLRLVSNWMG